MPFKLTESHQIVQLSNDFKLAFQKVNYKNFEKLENSIKASVFSFDEYYNSMSNKKRKTEWLSIRQLLINMGDDVDIYYDEHGKPHFTEGSEHLSISHSKESIAVSMHKSKEHGVDLQFLTPKIKRIRDKYLREEEIKALQSSSTLELSVYWSMKEALFKLYGKKDIFLKENIRIIGLQELNGKYTAKGEIINIPEKIEVDMEAILLEDYVLAYTLIM